MCATLAERCEPAPSKGFKAIHTTNFKTGKKRFFGVAYKRNAKDRGLMLNVCPFCYGEPGGFERDRASADEGGV
jgi:hypothetical protein